VYQPDKAGSKGAAGNSDVALGGGVGYIVVGDLFLLDGSILADGASGVDYGGGGSGGSLWLIVGKLHGTVG
jgi:hypothetical protein